MATMQAATTSEKVQITDPDAVRALVREYHFGGLTWLISDDPSVAHLNPGERQLRVTASGPGDYDDRAAEFFHRFRHYLAGGEVFDVQCVGHTKCRFPVHAVRYRVTPETVERITLDSRDELADPTE